MKKCKAVINIKEERDSKYECFRRTDVREWTRSRLYLGAILLPTRWIMCICFAVPLTLFVRIMMIGQD